MKQLIDQYTITLQDSVILFESSKTEVNLNVLDYIPGSIFRGVVAGKLITDSRIEATIVDDIIFNGGVQFGDAHLNFDGERSWQLPYSIYKPKQVLLEGENTFKHAHFGNADDMNTYVKQQRKGYVFVKGDTLQLREVQFEESIKSARDRKTGASKNGEMFLYRSISAGQSFTFQIRGSEDNLATIKKVLESATLRIGKSKSSQYGGSALVKYHDRGPQTTTDVIYPKLDKMTIVYAESHLCFINNFGMYSPRISGKDITGNAKDKIDWEKSRLRFFRYSPFNAYRKSFDPERWCIRKGSVIVFKGKVEIPQEAIKNGIGVHKTEGFGRILVNPPFLTNKGLSLVKWEEKSEEEKETTTGFTSLMIFLSKKTKEKQSEILLKEHSENWLKNNRNSNITASQWSRIYNKATSKNSLEEVYVRDQVNNDNPLEDWAEHIKKFIEFRVDKLNKKDTESISYVEANQIRDIQFLALQKIKSTNKQHQDV